MSATLCLYSTVFNNVQYVEQSISSVWRPDAEIVVVDSFSTDGTWEKLLILRKEFNLKLFRYKCSRGLGRQIALKKCRERSVTAYFDMDTTYYETFHKLIDYVTQHDNLRMLVPYVPTFIARREAVLERGGWRDLNYLEDNEMNSRVGFDIVAPVIIGRNVHVPGRGIMGPTRERRYGKYSRIIRVKIDKIKAQAPSYWRLAVTRDYTGMILYPIVRLIGLYRNRLPDNSTWIELAILVRSVPPKELGIDEKYFVFVASLPLLKLIYGGEKTVDSIVMKLIKRPIIKVYLSGKYKKLLYIKDKTLIDESVFDVFKGVEMV